MLKSFQNYNLFGGTFIYQSVRWADNLTFVPEERPQLGEDQAHLEQWTLSSVARLPDVSIESKIDKKNWFTQTTHTSFFQTVKQFLRKYLLCS